MFWLFAVGHSFIVAAFCSLSFLCVNGSIVGTARPADWMTLLAVLGVLLMGVPLGVYLAKAAIKEEQKEKE